MVAETLGNEINIFDTKQYLNQNTKSLYLNNFIKSNSS